MKSKNNHIFLILILTIIVLISILIYKGSFSLDEKNTSFNNNNFFNVNTNHVPFNSPDPYIFYKDGFYYLYATFSTSGIKYYKSQDLTNWADQGYIISASSFPNNITNSFNAYWAPEVFKYKDKYYMIFTAGTTSKNNYQLYIAQCNDGLTGTWEYYTTIPLSKYAADNIDGTIYIENDSIYLYYHSGADIYATQLSNDLKEIISEPQKIIAANQKWAMHSSTPLNEGPALIKHNNIYYLFYSANRYTTKYYAIGYATSNSPLGPFTDKTIDYPILSNENGPGHNSFFTIDNNDIFIVYHSIVWNNDGTYNFRKLNIDSITFDDNLLPWINNFSNSNQPLPSGHNNIYKLSKNEYRIYNNSTEVSMLNDSITNQANNTLKYNELQTINRVFETSKITIELNEYKKIKDIWLFGNDKGFQNRTVNVTLNNGTYIEKIELGTSNTAEIDLSNINFKIKKIELSFSSITMLSEISLYKDNNYENTEKNNNELIIDNNTITALNINDTFNSIVSKLKINDNVTFVNKNNISIDGNQNIKTGDKMLINKNEVNSIYTIAVLGDLTGDGEIKINDVAKLYRFIKNKDQLNDIEKKAADVTIDGEIKINDVAKLYRFIKIS